MRKERHCVDLEDSEAGVDAVGGSHSRGHKQVVEEVLLRGGISTGVVPDIGVVVVGARFENNDVSEVVQDREVILVVVRSEEVLRLQVILGV